MTRVTVDLDEEIHRILNLRAADGATTISELVNEAVKNALSEDLQDLEAFRAREKEETLDFESFAKCLKRDGRR